MNLSNAAASANRARASESKPDQRLVLRRHVRVRDAKPSSIVAYDLETTNIAAGTPRPLYITAFSESKSLSFRSEVRDIAHLREILINHFLTPANVGARFVAWNGNNFDAYLIAAALISEPGYTVRPFLTRSKNLRGMLVIVAGDEDLKPKEQRAWMFLDGIAMLGLAGVSLRKFLATFAPDHQKLDVIDFERESFDASNPLHCEYAMRDSEGLYHGMTRAEDILLSHFNEPLAVTMGRACIKILTAHIPERVSIVQPHPEIVEVIHSHAMRGGFCYCVRSYHGPVWKYDINQAYAAAMRESKLPEGNAFRNATLNRFAACYLVRITATHPNNITPFYYKTADQRGIVRAVFDAREIRETWVTSIEHKQLIAEGWRINVLECVYWESAFNLADYVNKLEHVRTTCEGGPSGAVGTMVKAVGNHSYGKTVERLDPLDLVLARECPPGFAEYFPEDSNVGLYFPHVWYRPREATPRAYHQPQIGAFITAHVRMVVRRAALLRPADWLYADTDCVMFSSDVTALMDIDPKRYGAWKLEASGDWYKIIAKKVYASDDGKTRHAKGLNVKHLTGEHFDQWYLGRVPEQEQTQRNSFVKVMRGQDMYRKQKRRGTDASRLRDRT
jgi:hypothetical protein